MSPPDDAADHHVVAAVERLLTGRRTGVAEHQVALAAAAFQPVVALVAGQRVEAFVADDDVVAETAQDDVVAAAAFDVVVAVAAEDGVDAVTAIDGVVAGVAMQGVVALATDDGVVAVAAEQEVGAAAAVDDVVAAVAPHRVGIGRTSRQLVIAGGAAKHDFVAEEVVVAEEHQQSPCAIARVTISLPVVGFFSQFVVLKRAVGVLQVASGCRCASENDVAGGIP